MCEITVNLVCFYELVMVGILYKQGHICIKGVLGELVAKHNVVECPEDKL